MNVRERVGQAPRGLAVAVLIVGAVVLAAALERHHAAPVAHLIVRPTEHPALVRLLAPAAAGPELVRITEVEGRRLSPWIRFPDTRVLESAAQEFVGRREVQTVLRCTIARRDSALCTRRDTRTEEVKLCRLAGDVPGDESQWPKACTAEAGAELVLGLFLSSPQPDLIGWRRGCIEAACREMSSK